MANSKLLKVMDYLINEQEDKARDLLHQIFIEKARAIHEEMLSDEEHEMGGDEGEDLGHDIRAHKEQIESEMHNGDGTMEDVDLDDAVEDLTVSAGDDEDADDVDVDVEDDDMDMDDEDDMDAEDDMDDEEMDADEAEMDADMDHDEEAEGERLKDIEQAIEELTAEFEAMKAELHGEHGDAEGDKMPLQEMADSGTTPGGKQYKISGDFETVTVNGTSYPIRKLSGQGDNPDYVIDDIHIGQTYQDMPHPDADEEDYEEEYEVWTEAPGQADNTLHVGTWDECWNFLIDQLGSEDHSRLKRRLQRDASGGGMREGWMDKTDDLDEDYDDLDEAIALDTVHVDLKKVGEVGSGKFSRSDVSKHSPVPKGVQSPVPGAKPVVTGKGSKADGYHLQSAPTSASMNLSNRRKKASEDMTHVSKEGSTKAMLNKDRSEGFGAANVRSPLGSTGTTPKK